jgi:hypothetical protein
MDKKLRVRNCETTSFPAIPIPGNKICRQVERFAASGRPVSFRFSAVAAGDNLLAVFRIPGTFRKASQENVACIASSGMQCFF